MTILTPPVRQPAIILRLWVGPLVWAAHFLAIYGFTALACARNAGVSVVVWFILAVTLFAGAVLGVTIGLALRDGRFSPSLTGLAEFLHGLTITIASLVMLALVWEALPALFIPVCSHGGA